MKECNSARPTEEDRFIVRQLKEDGLSYAAIMRATGFSYNSVKAWTDPEFAKKQHDYMMVWQRNKWKTDPEYRKKKNQATLEYFRFKSKNCPAFRVKKQLLSKERTRLIQDWKLSCILNGYEPLEVFRERVRGI